MGVKFTKCEIYGSTMVCPVSTFLKRCLNSSGADTNLKKGRSGFDLVTVVASKQIFFNIVFGQFRKVNHLNVEWHGK